MNLHFAQFQGPTCACCPFKVSVIGEITPPVLLRPRVLVVLIPHSRDDAPC
jgi:hypothetical protein